MMLIPAIDLRGGRVVRLQQGDYSRETHYSTDAIELAQAYQDAGAKLLHIVDLDSARSGGATNLAVIERICRAVSMPVQTGGGVRTQDDVQRRLDAGAARVVIGSLCVRDTALVCQWLATFGAKAIVAGLDVAQSVDGAWMPRAAGWTEAGSEDLFTLLERLTAAKLVHLLCTDIARDGMLGGPSLSLYHAIAKRGYLGLSVQASGGIGEPQHLHDVASTKVAACIVGRALLEGQVPMEAIGQWSQ